MSTVQLPARPDAAQVPTKSKRRWPWIAGVVVLLLVLASVASDTTEAPVTPAASSEPAITAPVSVTAAEFVDFAFTPKTQRNFCTAYFGLSDDAAAYRAFRTGAEQDGWVDDPSMPTLQEVFDELVGRCLR
jgi:hypothetical protein